MTFGRNGLVRGDGGADAKEIVLGSRVEGEQDGVGKSVDVVDSDDASFED